MKYLEISELDVLSRALNLSTPMLKVSTRVEAYSCKAVSRERKLFKTLESDLLQDISHSTSVSPPEQHPGLLDSAFGPLDKRESRKTLWLLIGLLNVAFPDHDFSKVRPEEFRREEGPRAVLSSLSLALDHLRSPSSQRSFSAYPPSSAFAFPSSPFNDPLTLPLTTPNLEGDSIPTNPFLRQVLDPIIDLAECEVYTYTPDMDSDPHAAESDDESDNDGDSDAFEKDSDSGVAWEMDDVPSTSYGLGSSRGRMLFGGGAEPSWKGRSTTPMKSFSSFFSAPGTPTGTDRSASEDHLAASSDNGSNGLLWSSNFFFFNKKMKRILFISMWARRPSEAHGSAKYSPLKIRSSAAAAAAMKRSSSVNSAYRERQLHSKKIKG